MGNEKKMQKKQIEYIPSARERERELRELYVMGIYERSERKKEFENQCKKNENFQLTETYRYRVNDSEIYL